jgi:Protein of unknown function (DUF3616)
MFRCDLPTCLKQAARPAANKDCTCPHSLQHLAVQVHNARMATHQIPAFQALTGIYEPSAVQQLPDGRLLVVEDEKEHPLSLVNIGVDGKVKTQALTASLLQMFSSFWKLDDLEGLAADRAGFIYAITSHSRTDDGDEKPSREKLVRFRIEGDRVVQPQVVDGLKAALVARHALLAAAAQVRDVKARGGLNIEGLEVDPGQQQLLIGLRSPLRDGRALIARVENLAGVFDSDEAPKIAPVLDELDLGGQGIRSLAYVPAVEAFLVISGPSSREDLGFGLWCWSGKPGATARRVKVPGLPGFAKAEGVCPAVIGGLERVVIVSDDGNRAAHRPAGYLVLDPGQFQFES